MKIRNIVIIAFLSASCLSYWQQIFAQSPVLDVNRYIFEIELNDSTDNIQGKSYIYYTCTRDSGVISFDLVQKDETGKGMVIDRIRDESGPVSFIHSQNKVILTGIKPASGQSYLIEINYHGIPADGLIISENKFGNRTFFGDNWPNRAHQWLPCIDHPSDKALVEFRVTAPSRYRVVSNGYCSSETMENDQIRSVWKSAEPLPTKVMVIGAAGMAVQELAIINGVPVSTWVYPENKTEGFRDYSAAIKPLVFLTHLIGPFPYPKLANVQSTTLYGGMENAGCIFYAENSVTGQGKAETLMAHEIAHQWFGDAVTENSWEHIWLSEGFATYLTALYIEDLYGKGAFLSYMANSAKDVFQFEKYRYSAIIDSTYTDPRQLLNPNSYDKASWVLHMLRKEIGDSLFIESLRSFYQNFRDKNAGTRDFIKQVESVTGRNHNPFFTQWLYRPGHPELTINWYYGDGKLQVGITQTQKGEFYTFPLDMKIIHKNSPSGMIRFMITGSCQSFSIDYKKIPVELIADPGNSILMEATVVKKSSPFDTEESR